MVDNNTQPLGQDGEHIEKHIYDNTSQELNHHIYIDSTGKYDHDVSDFIFKKGDYSNTYIVVHTNGVPNGVVLKLVDENLQQLYSPTDANSNWVTTVCSITVGQSNIIPLPAQFNSQLSNHTPFPAGTYNWKLVYSGNTNYEGIELPLTVEICDFKVWDILTPEIYPDGDVKVRVKTYANTYYPMNLFNTNLLTTNAIYDATTGIITYPNSDINTELGKYTQVINQANNCFIKYEVMNPIEFTCQGDVKYNVNKEIGYIMYPRNLFNSVNRQLNISINGNTTIPRNGYSMQFVSPCHLKNSYENNYYFPPGTYYCTVISEVSSNGKQYSCEGSFKVLTDDCNINLSFSYEDDDDILTSTYLYNTSVPIPNALMGLVNAQTNALITTATTNSNGQIQWNVGDGVYKVVAINVDNEYILSSEIIDLTSEYELITDISLNENNDFVIESVPSNNITEAIDLVTDVFFDSDNNIVVEKDTFGPNDDISEVISKAYIENNNHLIVETHNTNN